MDSQYANASHAVKITKLAVIKGWLGIIKDIIFFSSSEKPIFTE